MSADEKQVAPRRDPPNTSPKPEEPRKQQGLRVKSHIKAGPEIRNGGGGI